MLKRYPLKHPTPATVAQSVQPTEQQVDNTSSARNLSPIELYKSKINAKSVSDDEALKAVVPVKADVHTTDANHTEIDSKAISDGK